MRKCTLLLFVFVLTGLPLSAQSYKAMYEGEEKNLLDGAVVRDLFMLMISPNGINSFQSSYAVQRDSIRNAAVIAGLSQEEAVAQMRSVPTGTKARLFYNPKAMKYTELDYGLYYFKANENIKEPNYTFGGAKKEVAGYPSEMATARLYGRDWVIYYTPEIAFPYGPWKLNGLPGLVTEAYTVDGAYKFKLVGFKSLNKGVKIEVPNTMLSYPVREVSRDELMWIRKQIACKDFRPIVKKYSKNADMSGMQHDEVDRVYRKLSKRYQYIEK